MPYDPNSQQGYNLSIGGYPTNTQNGMYAQQQPYYSPQLGPGGSNYDPVGSMTGGAIQYGNQAFDPGNLALPFLNPTGYQQANYTPLEQQALMTSGSLMQQGGAPIGNLQSYLGPAASAAAAQYGALAPQIYSQGAQEAAGAASSAAARGISGGMGQGQQLQISDQTQRQLNALRGGLMGQAQQQALGARGQDVQNELGRLQASYNMSRYPQPKASPLGNIMSMIGGLTSGMGGGGGGGQGGGSPVWGGSAAYGGGS